jgi:hypothetical protein
MRIFLEEYLTTWNQTGAARVAKYAEPAVAGARLVNHPLIRAEIEKRIKQKAMTADEVLERFAQQARGDIAQFITIEERPDPKEEGKTITVAFLDISKVVMSGYSHLIKSISYTNNGPRIEMYDAQAALTKLGENLRLFGRNVNLNIDMSQFEDDELERIAGGEDPITILAERKRGDSSV